MRSSTLETSRLLGREELEPQDAATSQHLADDAKEVDNFNDERFRALEKKYNEMIKLATITDADKIIQSREERKVRIAKAKVIFEELACDNSDLAILFRLKFQLQGALKVSHVHLFDDSPVKKSTFAKTYYDVFKNRIKEGNIDPLTLLNMGIMNFNEYLTYGTVRSHTNTPIYLMLAWLYAENNALLKNEIEEIYRVVIKRTHGYAIDITNAIMRDVVKEWHIQVVLDQYSLAVRKEFMNKFITAQSARQQQSVAAGTLFSANAPQNEDEMVKKLTGDSQALQKAMFKAQRDLEELEKYLKTFQASRDQNPSPKAPGCN